MKNVMMRNILEALCKDVCIMAIPKLTYKHAICYIVAIEEHCASITTKFA